jgi:hypothetical protein
VHPIFIMFNEYKRRPGKLVQHEDGRKGIAYNNDQLDKFLEQNKLIVKFFIDNEIKNGLSKEKRAVLSDKLTIIGFID